MLLQQAKLTYRKLITLYIYRKQVIYHLQPFLKNIFNRCSENPEIARTLQYLIMMKYKKEC